MTEFFLIRHGATNLNNNTNNSVDKIRGWSDVPLSGEGKKEAQRTAIQLKGKGIDILVHSDLGRAAETAKIIAKILGIKSIPSKDLRPWNLGDFTGKSTKDALPEIGEYVKNKPNKPVPKGESFDKFKERAFKGVGDAIKKHPGKLVGVVTHHRVERLVKAWIDAGQPSNKNIKLSTFLEKGEPTGKAEKLKINPLGYFQGGTIRKRPTGGQLGDLPGEEDWGDLTGFHLGETVGQGENLARPIIPQGVPGTASPMVPGGRNPPDPNEDIADLLPSGRLDVTPPPQGLVKRQLLEDPTWRRTQKSIGQNNPFVGDLKQTYNVGNSEVNSFHTIHEGDMGGIQSDVSFGSKLNDPNEYTYPRRFGAKVGTEGLQILSTMNKNVKEFIDKAQPERVIFTAGSDNLIPTYQRFANNIAKQYNGHIDPNTSSDSHWEIVFPNFAKYKAGGGSVTGGTHDITHLFAPLEAHMASGGVPEGGQYKIQHGDTLGALSKRLGVPILELMKLNPNIKSKDVIRAGDILSWQKPTPPTPPISGPKTAPTSQRGQEPLPTVPGPQIDLPATQAPPVTTGAGGLPGGVGVGTALSKAPDPSDQFNPMSQNPGGAAAALKKAPQWTPGTEVNPPPNIPIEVVPPPDPTPSPPTSKGPSEPSLWEQIYNYIDPVSVLTGHAGDTDYKPTISDYAQTALMGIPSGTKLPSNGVDILDAPQPFRSTPGKAVERALNTTGPSPNAPGWYKPRPWDVPVGPERDAGSISPGSRPVFRGPDGNLRADPYADNVTPLSINPNARSRGGEMKSYAMGGLPKPPKSSFTGVKTPTPAKVGSGPTGTELGLGIRTGRMASGFLHSTVPGRTDKLNLNVGNGSYVLPADIIAGHGQGNSIAGASLLSKMFGMGPYGASAPRGAAVSRLPYARPMSNIGQAAGFRFPPPFRADGGMTPGGKTHVPVLAAGGEMILPPEVVLKIGGGNAERGFRVLDKFVLNSRKKQIEELKRLKPPRKD